MSKTHNILKSFPFAFSGLWSTLKNEPNFRIQLVLGVVAVALGFLFQIIWLEWAILLLTIFLVLILELVNTTLEAVVDLISPGYSEKAKIAKDVAAATVLISSLLSLIIGLLIFLPRILVFFY